MVKTVIGRRLYIKNVLSWNMTLCTLTYLYRVTQNDIPEDRVLGTINLTQYFFIFLKKCRRVSKVIVSFVAESKYPCPNYITFLDQVWQGRSIKFLSIQAQLEKSWLLLKPLKISAISTLWVTFSRPFNT